MNHFTPKRKTLQSCSLIFKSKFFIYFTLIKPYANIFVSGYIYSFKTVPNWRYRAGTKDIIS